MDKMLDRLNDLTIFTDGVTPAYGNLALENVMHW